MIDCCMGIAFSEIGINDNIKFDKMWAFVWMVKSFENWYLFDKNFKGFCSPSGMWSGTRNTMWDNSILNSAYQWTVTWYMNNKLDNWG